MAVAHRCFSGAEHMEEVADLATKGKPDFAALVMTGLTDEQAEIVKNKECHDFLTSTLVEGTVSLAMVGGECEGDDTMNAFVKALTHIGDKSFKEFTLRTFQKDDTVVAATQIQAVIAFGEKVLKYPHAEKHRLSWRSSTVPFLADQTMCRAWMHWMWTV